MPQEAEIRAELTGRLREFVAERGLDPAKVRAESRLDEDLELDSLDLMALAQEWAQDYGIIVNEEAVLDITTVGQILDFVVERLKVTGG